MGELDHLRIITKMMEHVVHDCNTKKMPTYFIAHEDDGCTGDCYAIEWDDDIHHISIGVDTETDEAIFCHVALINDKFEMITYEVIKDIDNLQVYIDVVNHYFK